MHLRDNPFNGSDFLSFYTGGKLLGTGDVYSDEAARRLQSALWHNRDFFPFVSLPWFAAAMWPFAIHAILDSFS